MNEIDNGGATWHNGYGQNRKNECFIGFIKHKKTEVRNEVRGKYSSDPSLIAPKWTHSELFSVLVGKVIIVGGVCR